MDGLLYNKCWENARDGGRGISQATRGRRHFLPSPLGRAARFGSESMSGGHREPNRDRARRRDGGPPLWQMRSAYLYRQLLAGPSSVSLRSTASPRGGSQESPCRRNHVPTSSVSLRSTASPEGKPRGERRKPPLRTAFMAFVFHRAALAGGGAALVFDRRAQGEEEGDGDDGDEEPVDGFHIRTTPRSA